jgi:proteic killer suppression protein
VIRSFRNRALRVLWERGNSARVRADLRERVLRRLDAMNAATRPGDLAVPGFDFHPLRGKPQHYSVHVNGPWCITFAWQDDDVVDVDLENYH